MKHKITIPIVTAAAFVAMAHPASAHVPLVTATCRNLTIELIQYQPGSTVTYTIDGVPTTIAFSTNDFRAVALDPTKDHAYSVVIDNRGDGLHADDAFDATFAGTTAACEVPATVITVPSIKLLPPTPVATPITPAPPGKIATPVIPDKPVLAVTGARTNALILVGSFFLTFGVSFVLLGRRAR